MRFTERNRANITSYWRNKQAKERALLQTNSINYVDLKARLFGYLAGDGYVCMRIERKRKISKVHNEVGFFPDNTQVLSAFVEALDKVYSIKPRIRKYDNYYDARFNSKVVVEDLLESAKFGVKSWSVPSFVKSDLRLAGRWLSAFFDAEGYITDKVIRIQTVNQSGIREIKELLDKFGIKSKLYSYSPKNPKWSKNFILIISEKSSRLQFLSEIGLTHKAKLAKLKKSLLIT